MIKLYLPILIPLCELEKFNESLVKRGELLPDIDVIDNWHIELENMNKNKEGGMYSDSFIYKVIMVRESTFSFTI